MEEGAEGDVLHDAYGRMWPFCNVVFSPRCGLLQK
jgi:hypothetical protein